MNVSRRNFLTSGLGVLGVVLSGPQIFALAAQAASIAPRAGGKERILVVVQMGGGNDGLNTVIPCGMGAYYQARPQLAIQPEQVLPLTGQIGLHPSMSGFADLCKQGKLAVIQAVGYPNPNRSHFRSMEIWQTAQPDRIADTGWLGRYLDLADTGTAGGAEHLFPAVNAGPLLPKTLSASKVIVPSVAGVADFRFRTDPRYADDRNAQVAAFTDIYSSFDLQRPHVDLLRKVGLDAREASDFLTRSVRSYKGTVAYPGNSFGDGMKFIAQMIAGGVNSRIYSIGLDSFDTHANQSRKQGTLLKQLSDGLAAFQKDLEAHQLDRDVIVLCFSEFGRRVSENAGRGTDHGTAGPVFVLGSPVKGGVYGDHPSLTDLDAGDLKFKIDFRTVYATILDRWLGADSRQILGGNFDSLAFV